MVGVANIILRNSIGNSYGHNDGTFSEYKFSVCA